MATVSKYRGKWKCQVRRKGYPPQSKTFTLKADAEAWGREIEIKMQNGVFISTDNEDRPEVDQEMTVKDLLDKYLKEESPKKRSLEADKARIPTLQAELGSYSIHTLTSDRLAKYKRDRLALRSPQTVLHELNLLHRAYVVASEEWGVKLRGPIPKARKPELPPGRSNRITPKDITKIIQATESVELGELVTMAVETAMRRGELLNLRIEQVDFKRKSLYIPRTKTDTPRTIPLTNKALALLRTHARKKEGPVFTLAGYSVSQAFRRAVGRCGMPHLVFHDLRHEAISRLFEKGLNVIEVSRISGHKTLSQLDRYTHLDVTHLGNKLRG